MRVGFSLEKRRPGDAFLDLKRTFKKDGSKFLEEDVVIR